MKTKIIHLLSSALLALVMGYAASAQPAQAPAINHPGDAPLSLKSMGKGYVLKIKGAGTTQGSWKYGLGGLSVDNYFNHFVADESITFLTATSYRDPDGDEFSCTYKKVDNFTAEINFTQTKAGGGDTLKNEFGKGNFTLLFTKYDKRANTLHGTFVWSDSYKGTGFYDKEGVPGNYTDTTTATGIFSLRIK